MKLKTSKIAIETAADVALEKITRTVNEGFLGGRISKGQVASWLMSRMAESFDEDDVRRVQNLYFNKVRYVETLAKLMRQADKKGEDAVVYEMKICAALKQEKRTKAPREPKEPERSLVQSKS